MVRQLLQNNKKYLSATYLTLALLTLSTITTYAQPGGGGGVPLCDPDDNCPLDTWVIILTVCALVLATIHLYRKQKIAPQF